MEIKKVLVTGSAGYIGSVCVPYLRAHGYNVFGMDTGFYDDSFEKLSETFLKKDIRKITEKDLNGFDAIIHLAALSNDPIGELDPLLTEEINEKATLNLANLAKKSGVKRFIFASSCSVYGKSDTEMVNEQSPVNPLTAYARSKRAVEEGLQKLADKSFVVCLMRNSTVYGYAPKFRNDLVVNNLVSTAVATGEIHIMSDGTPWRPLIDVRDLAEIMIAFLKAEASSVNGVIYNIGFAENNYQVKEIAAIIQGCLPTCRITYEKDQSSDNRSYKVDFSLFRKAFPQIKQQWPLKKSIQDLADMLKNHHFSKKDLNEKKYMRIQELTSKIKKGILSTQLTFNTL